MSFIHHPGSCWTICVRIGPQNWPLPSRVSFVVCSVIASEANRDHRVHNPVWDPPWWVKLFHRPPYKHSAPQTPHLLLFHPMRTQHVRVQGLPMVRQRGRRSHRPRNTTTSPKLHSTARDLALASFNVVSNLSVQHIWHPSVPLCSSF